LSASALRPAGNNKNVRERLASAVRSPGRQQRYARHDAHGRHGAAAGRRRSRPVGV